MTDEPAGRGVDDADRDPSDWLAAQFEPGTEPVSDSEPASDEEQESPREATPPVPVVPVVPRRAAQLPFLAVPPPPTDETAVTRSSGHPMALDLGALRGAMSPGPDESPTTPSDDARPASSPEPSPPEPSPAEPSAVERSADRPEDGEPGRSVPVPTSTPSPSGEPGPFTAILTTPAAASDISAEPRTFDWNALPPESETARSEVAPPESPSAPAPVEPQPQSQPEPEPQPQPTPQAAPPAPAPAPAVDELPPTQAHDVVVSDTATRAFDLPADAGSVDEEEWVVDHAPPVVETPVVETPTVATRTIEPSSPEAPAAAAPEGLVSQAPASENAAPEAAASEDPAPENPAPGEATSENPAAEPAAPAAPETPASTPGAPWWVEEHHEMTRRERRLAEAAGHLPPPAATPPVETPPAGAPATAPVDGAPADVRASSPASPGDSEPEPTFTQILGIIRQPEPEEPSDGPPAGSWSLADDDDGGDDVDRPRPVSSDDEGIDDAATSALPLRARRTPSDSPLAPLFGDSGPGADAGPAAGDRPGPRRSRSPEPEPDPVATGETPSRRRDAGSRSTRASSGGGIEDWPRGRKILLGVGAAVVIVLALLALFLLGRSAFGSTEALVATTSWSIGVTPEGPVVDLRR